ncbi:glycosyl hydrolase [Asanoa ishikariensis]|uniref:6-phospho-beta-glucosidase n=1 Tax=Asanoa ishikariensis TaxID=137265 RepID=A0A1H3S041_9ACTN|nr:hypothetical protein [Asanoa ishikariensis]GIF66637.1 glycosyl hydrolase [Asanoa ishikariensis]SDZ31312.1 6-phospho-beta-glucosidase [Asanoa ishikariensis]
MNLLLVGVGVTTPLVLGSLVARWESLELERICLYDVSPERTRSLAALVGFVRESHPHARITMTSDIRVAEASAPDCCVISIRPGLERGRVADEQRAKELGYLANETVGAAGLAFACRALPAAAMLVERIERSNPACVFVNFTNPAGIVTAGLSRQPGRTVFGVCSSAEKSARALGTPGRVLTYGLNHLSWIYAIERDGADQLPLVLDDPALLEAAQPWFPPSVPRDYHALANEYLYYYDLHEHAMAAQRSAASTRAEVVERLNASCRAELAAAGDDSKLAFSAYTAYLAQRKRSYMAGALGSGNVDSLYVLNDDDGYSGPAIKVIEGAVLGRDRVVTAITANDVSPNLPAGVGIECTVEIRDRRVRKIVPTSLSPRAMALIQQVAAYEATLLEALTTRHVDGLVAALGLHPLTPSQDTNATFVARTVAAWPEVFASWSRD